MKKAYDTVWRGEVLNSFHNVGLRGNLSMFLENCLTNREFFVRVGTSTEIISSRKKYNKEASSVTRFTIPINDIVKQLS